jgi:hypothetical protein
MKLNKHQVFTKVGPEFVCYEKSRVGKKLRVEIHLRLNLSRMAEAYGSKSPNIGAGKSRFAVKRELGI